MNHFVFRDFGDGSDRDLTRNCWYLVSSTFKKGQRYETFTVLSGNTFGRLEGVSRGKSNPLLVSTISLQKLSLS